jgi:hypothetical protein
MQIFKRNWAMRSLCFSLFLLFLGCEPSVSEKRERIAGVYQAEEGDFKEKLVLKKNGEFQQTISSENRTFEGTGKWWPLAEGNELRFSGTFFARHEVGSGRLLGTPKEFSSFTGWWDGRKKAVDFEVDGEGKYLLEKSEND